MLILFSPFLLVLLLISYLETGASPVFKQSRSLTDEQSFFKMYKIRTIQKFNKDTTEISRRFLMSPGLIEKVSPLCLLFRKYGLDELPQLINVIKGDMSLVGPRPLDKFDLNILKADYPALNEKRNKLKCKPGIFGLWQLYGRRDLKAENLLYWDLRYDRNISLKNDLRIILYTLQAILRKKKEDSINTLVVNA